MSGSAVPPEILARFRSIARERLARIEAAWEALLDGQGGPELAASLMRDLHTLKGDARLVGHTDVSLLCHRLEELFTAKFADGLKTGRVIQYNLQLQHEVTSIATVFKLGYVGNLGRRLDTVYNFNQQDPGPGSILSRRPLRDVAPGVQTVNYSVSDGKSAYHSLQASAEKRFSSGMSFLTAYT